MAISHCCFNSLTLGVIFSGSVCILWSLIIFIIWISLFPHIGIFVYVPFLQTPVLPKHRIAFSHHQSILRLSNVVLYHQFLIIDWAISLSMHTYPRAFLLLKNNNKNKLSWPIIPVWLPFHFHSLSLFSHFLLTLNPTSSLQWNCSYQSPMTSIFPNSVEY